MKWTWVLSTRGHFVRDEYDLMIAADRERERVVVYGESAYPGVSVRLRLVSLMPVSLPPS